MYAFESSGSRKALHAMTIGAFIGAVALIASSGGNIIPPIILQLAGIILAGVSDYLLTRYSLKVYRYAIEPSGITDEHGVEQFDLVITEMVGRRSVVVSRVCLRSIDREAVTVLRRDDPSFKTARTAVCSTYQKFRYINTPIAPAECYIPFPSENAIIIIPPDPYMVKHLRGE